MKLQDIRRGKVSLNKRGFLLPSYGCLLGITATFGLLIADAALAIDRFVPQQYSSIQSAIDASSAGDTVIVGAGVFVEGTSVYQGNGFPTGLNIRQKDNLILRGSGAGQTFVDLGSGFDGYGVMIDQSRNVHIEDLAVINDTANFGAFHFFNGSSTCTISRVLIDLPAYRFAVIDSFYPGLEIRNCTIVGQGASYLLADSGTNPHSHIIQDSIIVGLAGLRQNSFPLAVYYSNLWQVDDPSYTQGSMNLSVDPAFNAPEIGDYRLISNTVCTTASSTGEHIGALPVVPGPLQANITGTITYSGTQTGAVHVVATNTAGDVFGGLGFTLGPYMITNIDTVGNYHVSAFRDSNVDGVRDPWEAQGAYLGNPVYLYRDYSDANITLMENRTVDTDLDQLPGYDEFYIYGTMPGVADSDDDGSNDGDEVFAGTNPLNPASFPVSVSGLISYAGTQTGTIHAIASGTFVRTASLVIPGQYSITNIPNQAAYQICAFRDSSGNGLFDPWEAFGSYEQNPVYLNVNTGMIDLVLQEDATVDTDLDGLPDFAEVYSHQTDPYVQDSDDDGLSDWTEVLRHGSDPNQTDSEGDGMNDRWEVRYGLNPLLDDALADRDGDGVANGEEFLLESNPSDWDTDKDGLSDGKEVHQTGSSPILHDTDGDGFDDGEEYAMNTSPSHSGDPIVIDDDAPGDPVPGDPTQSDPLEDGALIHPFDAIQDGINSASNGLTVLVLDGVYQGAGNDNLNTLGLAITVRSLRGASETWIQSSVFQGFVFENSEDTNTVIEGFTIHTWKDFLGSEGILCNGAGPLIRRCVLWDCGTAGILIINGGAPAVMDCEISENQGGIEILGSNPMFSRCKIVDNLDVTGSGIYLDGPSAAMFENCLISGNVALEGGGGMYIGSGSTGMFVNCTIADNIAGECGGGLSNHGSSALRNCIEWGNSAPTDPAIAFTAPISIEYSTLQIFWPGLGNSTSDPMLNMGSDYMLVTNSPAIDTGSASFSPSPDLVGTGRPLDGNGNGSAQMDRGAFEFVATAVDSDGDGMLDQWEILNGLDPTLDDSDRDIDGDWVVNLDEYTRGTNPLLVDSDGDKSRDGEEDLAGTFPLDPLSFLAVNEIRCEQETSGDVAIRWDSQIGRNYRLYESPVVFSPDWLLVHEQEGMGATMSYTNTDVSQADYYRLEVERISP